MFSESGQLAPKFDFMLGADGTARLPLLKFPKAKHVAHAWAKEKGGSTAGHQGGVSSSAGSSKGGRSSSQPAESAALSGRTRYSGAQVRVGLLWQLTGSRCHYRLCAYIDRVHPASAGVG
jgi:hypothetical protein